MYAFERRTTTFYRSAVCRSMSNKVIAGVCGGLGEHFGVSTKWLRIGMIIFAVSVFPAAIIFYAICVLVMPKGPGLGRERAFGRDRHHSVPPIPHYAEAITTDHLQREFNDIEARIRTLEDYVTSREYVLKRKFESL